MSELDTISTKKEDIKQNEDFEYQWSENEEEERVRQDEWENEKVKSIISTNAKMFILCILIFAYFTAIIILRMTGVISSRFSFVLSIPPVIVLLIVYLVHRSNYGLK